MVRMPSEAPLVFNKWDLGQVLKTKKKGGKNEDVISQENSTCGLFAISTGAVINTRLFSKAYMLRILFYLYFNVYIHVIFIFLA